jgi:CRP-like cAMP-binding protein
MSNLAENQVMERKALNKEKTIHDNILRANLQESVLQALRASYGSRELAAKALGISPESLQQILSRMRSNGIVIPRTDRTIPA